MTGFAVEVDLPPELPGAPEHGVIIDEPVNNVIELREALKRRLPEAAEKLDDRSLNIAVNGEMLLSGEKQASLRNGDQVTIVPMLAGG